MKKGMIVGLGVLMISFASCNEKKSTESAETVETTADKPVVVTKENKALTGSWELISIHTEETEGKKVEELFPGKKPTLNFEGNLMVHGTDGCNNITGEYEVKGTNEIVIGDKLAATRMFCEGVSDFAFMKGLTEVTTYEVTESGLLFKKGDKIVMEFKEVAAESIQ